MSDGLPAHRRALARAVLATGTLFGIGYLAYSLVANPNAVAINFEVYRAAAADVLAGDTVYGRSPVGDPNFTYRYPPILLVWFAAYLLVPPVVGYLLHTAGTVAVGVALGALLASETSRHGIEVAPLDRLLIVGFVTVGSSVAPSLLYGNVNHHVGLAVALGLIWLARGRESRAGATLAVAALPKVFPAGVGLWLLRRRAWRAVGAALATGLSALAAGAVVFGPGRTRRYVTAELLPRASPESFAGGLAPSSELVSLRRPLSVLLPGLGETTLAVAALALLAPVVGYCYLHASGPTGRLVGVFVTLAAVLLALPSYSLYWSVLAYPLVPLLYMLDSPAGGLFAAGALVTTLTLKLPDIALLVRSVPLPNTVENGVLSAATAVYTVGTPVLWGTAAMLAACVWWARTE